MEVYQIRRLDLNNQKETILGVCMDYLVALCKVLEYQVAPREKGIYYNFFVDKVEVIQ